MTKQILPFSTFVGGMATGLKEGLRGSFRYGPHMDFRKTPSQMSILPQPTRATGTNIDGLIQDMVQINNGERWALTDNGKLYRIATNGTWSPAGDLGSGAGSLIYRADLDMIVAMSATKATKIANVSGANSGPNLQTNLYAQSRSTDTLAYRTGGLETYTIPTALSEVASGKNSFSSDIEPLYSIKVFCVTKGSGNWTLTLHDPADNVVGTASIANADLASNQLVEFVFSTPLRILVKPNARQYHFHITSTASDSIVRTATDGDLSTCDYEIWADRFVNTTNGLHPAAIFGKDILIGNGNYLSAWEPLEETPTNLEWVRHRLTFPPGYEVCGVARFNEFTAIACERRSSAVDREFQDGLIFFWDGTSTTYNYFIPVPEGSPQGLSEYKNTLYYIAGGTLYAYAGRTPSKIRTLPGTDGEYSNAADYIVVNPNVITVRRGIMLVGFPSQTNNVELEHAVYSYGAPDNSYDQAFGLNYSTSNNEKYNTSGTLRIGMVKNFGDTLYISYRKLDGTYGVDVVDNNCDPATTASFESLIADNRRPWKPKTADRLVVGFEPLPAGFTLTPKWRIDRAASWSTKPTSVAIAGDTKVVVDIDLQFKEIEVGFDVTHTAGTETPVITYLALLYDDNEEDTQFP